MHFLIGLNSSFSQIRSSILSVVPLPSLSRVFSLVLQEERQRNIDGNLSSVSPMLSEQPTPFANATSSTYNRGKDRFLCSYCGRTNHTVDRCFSLHGFPPGSGYGRGRGKPNSRENFQPKSVNCVDDSLSDVDDTHAPSAPAAMSAPSLDQCQQLIALLQSQLSQSSTTSSATATASSKPSTSSLPSTSPFTGTTIFSPIIASISCSVPWLLDTGTTHHVCCSISLFTSLFPVHNTSVNLPNGNTAAVTHMGTIHLSDTITLSSVLLVPSFSFNLISVSSLTQSLSCNVIFNHDSFIIQEASLGTVIGKGNRLGNLYTLDVSQPHKFSTGSNSASSSVVNAVSLNLWHQRLGHSSFTKLKLMSDLLHCSSSSSSNSVCDICPLAKQKRLPFPISTSVSSCIFDLIHCDIWGPYSTSTSQGFNYFLTIVDDYSRFVWTFLLSHKSDVKLVLSQFFNTILTQFSKKIKAIRCDNGPEFNLNSLFSSFGTVIQHSCVETPQQNARVERKHQHLLIVARSLLFQSHLPVEFWGDCVLTASYIINRIPSSVLPNLSSPFQMLFHKPPSYDHLRTFGCLCYASTLDRDMDKFSPRATKCVFLGYPPDYKGYKVLDLASMQSFISRNVVFHEDIFPLSHLPSSPFPDRHVHISSPPSNFSSSSHNSLLSDPNSSLSSASPIIQAAENTLKSSSASSIIPVAENAPTTRLGRTSKTPTHLTDYICNNVSSSSPYPISSYPFLFKAISYLSQIHSPNVCYS